MREVVLRALQVCADNLLGHGVVEEGVREEQMEADQVRALPTGAWGRSERDAIHPDTPGVGALGSVLVAGDAAALCMAGVALGDIHLCFVWQAWRLVTCIFVLHGRHGAWSHPRGRCGTYGSGLALVARLGRF